MKLFAAALGIVSICVAGLGAQVTSGTEITSKTKERTKVQVKDGKDVTIAGCVAANADGGYILTNDVGAFKYTLVTDDNLSKYVGRHVEVKGVATDRGDAKVKVESNIGTTGEVNGVKVDDSKKKQTTEMKGALDLHYLAVRSVKKLSDTCR
jgi:hypothetical protein